MAGTLMPGLLTVLDNAGLIVNGAKVFFYATGTSTKQNAYSSAALSVALSNPALADSAGRLKAYLDPALPNYDIRVCPADASDPPSSSYYDLLNVSAVPSDDEASGDITVTAGENITAGDWVYLSLGDGGRTVGRWYKTDADLVYASTGARGLGVATADIATGTTGNVRIQGTYSAASGLTAGSKYYLSGTAGAITATAPTNARLVAIAYSTTAYFVANWNYQYTPDYVITPAVTGGETVAVGEWCYQEVGGSGQWFKTDATTAAKSMNPYHVGVCTAAMGAGTAGSVQIAGVYDGASGLVAGSAYYVTTTPGVISGTPPGSNPRAVGVALSATKIALINPMIFADGVVRNSLFNAPTGTGAIVLANAPAFTAVPTFTPGAGATTATVSGCVYMNTTSTGSVGNGLQILYTTSISANTLNANGDSLRVTFWGTSVSTANAKSVSLAFGNGAGTYSFFGSLVSTDTRWHLQGNIIRTGSASQVYESVCASSAGSSAGTVTLDNGTASADTTLVIDIYATCNPGVVGSSNNDIVAKGMFIEVIN